jgi:MFS family permease
MKTVIDKPVIKFCTLGAMFRFFEQYAIDYYLPLYFLKQFPQFSSQYSILVAIITVFGGISANLSGGIIADRFNERYPSTYSNICMTGSILGLPFFLATILTNNFWIAMAMYFLRYITGENFWSPNLTFI